MASLISEAHLLEARTAMATETPAIPPEKKRKSRKRPLSNPVVTRRRERQRETQRPASASQARRDDPVHEEGLQLEHQEFGSLETHLQELRDTLTTVQVPEATDGTVSAWAQRQLLTDVKMKTARPMLFNAKLSAERIAIQKCHRCCAEELLELLGAWTVFHWTWSSSVQPVTWRPTRGISSMTERLCSMDFWSPFPLQLLWWWMKMASLSFVNKYVNCLFLLQGQSVNALMTSQLLLGSIFLWSPSTDDTMSACLGNPVHPALQNGLLRLKTCFCIGTGQLAPAASWLHIYKYDVFTSFEHMKVTAPAMSRQAFLKMLEHRSVQAGRTGSICADTFQRSFFEFCFCQYKQEDMCQIHHFVCPACSPDMLAVCCDGNRKHYRFSKSKGTEEPPIYEGLFLAKDEEVATFVDLVRGNMKSGNDSAVCGTAKFTAGREMSKKSGAQIDEEGIQVAVCRHGFLLRGLNHFRGEIYAYPMFLQKEMSKKANVDFFCMDVTCRYWPYLNKIAEGLPELLPLTEMRPFLSVMHAKAHTAKCEVRWGGRSQDGAGNTVREEVEQVNSFLSRAALVTKYMTKSGRVNMLTQQAMDWNRRKRDNLHHVLAHRYVKITERAKVEAASFSDFKKEHNLDQETIQQWVYDVRQWAVTERVYAPGCTEGLRVDIENITVTLLRRKQDLYRQHDSNQARQRKRKRMRELKKKLREKVVQYNTGVQGEQIDEELACSLTEGYILPWERHANGNTFRLKRSVFDQVMLVRRLEEEQSILVKEMSQHIMFLLKEVEALRGHTLEGIKTNNFGDLTEDAAHGLKSVLSRRWHFLKSQHKQAVHAYSGVAALECHDLQLQQDIEESDDNDYTSPESEEEDL
ncbi:uncharacterized protein [Pseudochaenichthys georgianus]|uniref:uncharacterized protein isoform X4 n=1 Tax=Pseudochaenichthys georgianus TaxID=52239 RepID=UPI00146F1C5E|nr:uncharacterized protein LOC117442486 isoform X4 [Pseudochaenichthys georgianus]